MPVVRRLVSLTAEDGEVHDALFEIDERAARAPAARQRAGRRAGARARHHGQLPRRHAALLPGAGGAGRLPGAGARDADGQRRPALRPGDLRGGDPGRRGRGGAGCASRASTRSCCRATPSGATLATRVAALQPSPTSPAWSAWPTPGGCPSRCAAAPTATGRRPATRSSPSWCAQAIGDAASSPDTPASRPAAPSTA